MSAISENAKAVFLEAVEKHSPEAWPRFLDQACNDDRDLRGMVAGNSGESSMSSFLVSQISTWTTVPRQKDLKQRFRRTPTGCSLA